MFWQAGGASDPYGIALKARLTSDGLPLYGTLFVLLRLEEYALVAGSGVLFALLATAMVVTRRVDWYRLGDTSHEPPAHPYREGPRSV